MVRLEKDGKQLLITAIVFLVLAAIAVALRFVAKSKTKHRFAFDDVCMLVTAVIYAAWAGLVIGSKQRNAPAEIYLLMRIGVVDIGGTYDTSALPDPLPQLKKIYKVVLLRSTCIFSSITLNHSCSTLPSFFSYGESLQPRSPYSLGMDPSLQRERSDTQKTLY